MHEQRNQLVLDFMQRHRKTDPQNEILKHFQRGDSLTVLEALKLYHTTELRRVVSRLKKQGFNIISEPVKGQNYNKYELRD
jgi:hypothetical protein